MTSAELAASPIACNLAAMDPTQRARHQILLHHWTRAIQATEELPNGYAFQFEPDDALWMTLADFITLQRRCCPFLEFALIRARDHGPMRLALTGREGVRELLKSAFALG